MTRFKLILSAALLSLLLGGCQLIPMEEAPPVIPVVQTTKPVTYDQVTVTRGDLTLKKTVFCEYTTAQTQELSFALGGEKIAAVYVQEGDTVSKGDLLAELEHETVSQQIAAQEHRLDVLKLEKTHLQETKALELARQDAALAEAAAMQAEVAAQQTALEAWNQLQKAYEEALALWEADPLKDEALKPQPPEACTVTATAEALAEEAETLIRRERDLQNDKAATENRFDQQIDSKSNSIYIQSLRLEELEEQLDKRRIYAGMDGMVRYVQTSRVQNTAPDGSISYSNQIVGQTSVREATFIILVDTDSLAFTVSGDNAALFPLDTQVTIRLEDREIPAVSVAGENPHIAYLQPTPPDPTLETGDTGNIELLLDQRSNVLLLPVGAIHTTGEEEFVYIINEEGLRVMQTVTTGLRSDGYAEIVTGLSLGDSVIVE